MGNRDFQPDKWTNQLIIIVIAIMVVIITTIIAIIGNPDRAIDLATREFLAAHSYYTLGHLLVYLSQRVPVLRAELAAAAKRRRAHDAKVHELIERIAA